MVRGMKLREYLKAEKITLTAFAEQVGVTPVALYRYMAGVRQPRRETVDKIVAASNGSVTAGDLHVPTRSAA